MKTEKQFCRELCGYQVLLGNEKHAKKTRSLAERAGFELTESWLAPNESVLFFNDDGNFESCRYDGEYPIITLPQLRKIVEKWEKAKEKPEVE